MSFYNKIWQGLTSSIAKWGQSLWNFFLAHKKTSIISLVSVILLLIGGVVTYQYYSSNIHTVYHVKVDGKELGTVTDPAVVQEKLDEWLAEKKESYPNLEFSIDEKIAFEEEQLYKGEADDKKVVALLEKEIEIHAEAVKLVINGEVVGYVDNEQTLNQILEQLKATYSEVNKNVKLVQAAGKDSDSDGESTSVEVLDTRIKDSIQTLKEKVSPDQVLTKDQLKELLEKGGIEQKKHVVQPGDCLSCIADKYDMRTRDVIALNPGFTEDTILQIGQEVIVSGYEPKVHVETVEKRIEEEQIDYEIETRKDNSLYAGERKVVQNGQKGKKLVTYQVTKENGVEIDREKLGEEIVSEPVPKIVAVGTKIVASRGSGRFQWPTHGGRVTSGYGQRWGRMHVGVDIAGVSNRNIMAADSGVVEYAGWKGGYGNCIIINHNNGYKTLYGHLSSIKVSVGQKVGKGQTIGVMGSTGNSTGVHLHFEVIKNGSNLNPLTVLR